MCICITFFHSMILVNVALKKLLVFHLYKFTQYIIQFFTQTVAPVHAATGALPAKPSQLSLRSYLPRQSTFCKYHSSKDNALRAQSVCDFWLHYFNKSVISILNLMNLSVAVSVSLLYTFDGFAFVNVLLRVTHSTGSGYHLLPTEFSNSK